MLTTMALIVCWVVAPLATFSFGSTWYSAMKYPGSLEQRLDRIQGYTKTYQPLKPAILALVTWSFIIAYYVEHA